MVLLVYGYFDFVIKAIKSTMKVGYKNNYPVIV